MRTSKLLSILIVAIIAIAALATSVSAYTSAELSDYVTGTHTISGSQFQLRAAEKQEVKDYLANNPLTDEQATQIKSLLDQAKNKISATGASNLNQISKETKAQVVTLLKQAGNIAGLTVSVNSDAQTVTISNGTTVLLNGSYAMEGNAGITVRTYTNPAAVGGNSGATSGSTISGYVYTGSNNTVFIVVAVLAVVAVSTIVIKKVYAK